MLRKARFHDVASSLENRILENEWPVNHKLPSVRALAEEYEVAAATASRAFEVLRGKGVIRPDERSGVFRVADRSQRNDVAADHWAVCLRITSGPGFRGAMATLQTGFVESMTNKGLRLNFDAIPNDLNMPAVKLKRHVDDARAAGVTGLFFMPSRVDDKLAEDDERLLQICKKANLPVVLIDRYLRGENPPVEWDLVSPDYAHGGYSCATHLFNNGRRRLAFVRASPTSSHNDMVTGFLAAHYHARNRGVLPRDSAFPLVYDFPEAGSRAYSGLCDQLVADGVDGVVCYRDRVVIGLSIELLSRHRRIPRDVALTGFDDQPIGSEFTLGVTTYALPSRDVASRAFEVMRCRRVSPNMPPVKVLVPGRLVVRESSVESSAEFPQGQ